MASRHAQLVYVDAERAVTTHSKLLLTNASKPRTRWSTVKTAIFGVSLSLPPFVRQGR